MIDLYCNSDIVIHVGDFTDRYKCIIEVKDLNLWLHCNEKI
jgi:hypothetical protein